MPVSKTVDRGSNPRGPAVVNEKHLQQIAGGVFHLARALRHVRRLRETETCRFATVESGSTALSRFGT